MRNSRLLLQVTGGKRWNRWKRKILIWFLLDVMMPDMSGFEVAQHLKSNPNTADIPIIFLTALNSTADIVKGFQVGANDFISKPFNKEELIIRVTHQISW